VLDLLVVELQDEVEELEFRRERVRRGAMRSMDEEDAEEPGEMLMCEEREVMNKRSAVVTSAIFSVFNLDTPKI